MHAPHRFPHFAFLILAIGIGSQGLSVEKRPLIDSVSISATLNAQWQEKVVQDLQSVGHSVKFAPTPKPRLAHGCLCGGVGFRIGGALTTLPAVSKNRFADLNRPFAEALQECTRIKIVSIESSLLLPPDLAAAFCDSLYEGHRITSRSETADAFIAIYSFKLLSQTLEPAPEYDDLWENAEGTMQKEIERSRPSRSPPSIIVEYEGNYWLRAELFLDHCVAIVRSKDKWGKYTFSKTGAAALQSGFDTLHAIHATEPDAE